MSSDDHQETRGGLPSDMPLDDYEKRHRPRAMLVAELVSLYRTALPEYDYEVLLNLAERTIDRLGVALLVIEPDEPVDTATVEREDAVSIEVPLSHVADGDGALMRQRMSQQGATMGEPQDE